MPLPRSARLKFLNLSLVTAITVSVVHPAVPAADFPDPPGSAWERAPGEPPASGACQEIDSVFVIPVQAAERAAAVAHLERVSAIPVDLAQVARLGFDVPPPAETLRYQKRLRREIDDLQAERRRAVEDQARSWTLSDEQRLRGLVDLYHDDSAPPLFPYLVRAVALKERTGEFSVRLCAGDLWIDHASRGRANPQTIRLPVIVYLAQRPRAVFATWSLAN